MTDQRLTPLAQELAEGRYEVLSLDVFDTLLWRRVPEPADIFALVGAQLIEQDQLAHGVSVTQFAELRAAAEKQVRAVAEAQTGSREVVLIDIYETLPSHILIASDGPDVAAEVEVAIERDAMLLDREVAGLMDVARDHNVRVVLTSDTYFIRDQLLSFLSAAGLEPDRIPEILFISNEQGRPKWRDLFDVVLQDLAVSPERMVHVGDNVDADVRPCAARKIAHVFYDKWSGLPRTQEEEFPRAPQDRARWLSNGGDAGLTGLRSRLAYRAPADLESDLKPYWVYGATTLAPLFAAYAQWVVATAVEQKANVLGLMREGRFLSQLVAQVAEHLGHDISTGEVWLSRRAVVRAALWPDDLSLLAQAISYCPGPSTDDILEQLGVSRADLIGVFKDPAAVDLHAMGGVQALLTGISQSVELQEKITSHSAELRKNLLAYLEAQGAIQDDTPIIVLDLGYAGTIQTVLQKILDYEGRPARITGFYVAVNAKGKDRILAGVDLRALVSADGYDNGLVTLLERTPDILEHACMCPEGSLDSFDDSGQPVLLPSQRSASQIVQMEAMQAGILAGVTAVIDMLGAEAVTLPGFHQHAVDIVKQAMLHPTPDDIRTIGAWLHEANFDLSDQRALADLRVDSLELEYGGASAWSGLERHEAYWPQAALARVAPVLSEVTNLVGDGYSPEVFTSGSTLGVLSIVPDLGVGPDERKAVVVPLSVSTLGRGEIQVRVKPMGPDAHQALHLRWPAARSLIMVEQCAVLFRGDADQHIENVTQALKPEGDVQVINDALMAGGGGATLTVDLSSMLPAWPHSLDLLIRFKYLRIDRLYSSSMT